MKQPLLIVFTLASVFGSIISPSSNLPGQTLIEEANFKYSSDLLLFQPLMGGRGWKEALSNPNSKMDYTNIDIGTLISKSDQNIALTTKAKVSGYIQNYNPINQLSKAKILNFSQIQDIQRQLIMDQISWTQNSILSNSKEADPYRLNVLRYADLWLNKKTYSQWLTPAVKQSTMSSGNFTTLTIQNYCPEEVFTVFIQSTCTNAINIIDERDKTYKQLSMGNGAPDIIRFTTQMKKFKLKFIVSDPCQFPAIQFKLYQSRISCVQCESPVMHTWNPQTCKCDCANRFTKCQEPQEWKPYPICTCGCKDSLVRVCDKGSYFDLRECSCKKIQCKGTSI